MQLSTKTFFITLSATIIIASGAAYFKLNYYQEKNEVTEIKTLRLKTTKQNILPTKEKTMCIQVITRAINPSTGLEQDFPTPCDVPQGWQTIK
jgi:hypothetical protein